MGEPCCNIWWIFQTPRPHVLDSPEGEGAFTTSGGPEEVLTEYLRHPLAFGLHAIDFCDVGQNRRVVCLERCVEAVENSSGVGCLVVIFGGYEAFGIVSPWYFDGLQEVSEELVQTFEVIVGWLPCGGRKFGRPVLEEGSDLFDIGYIGHLYLHKLITSYEERHGTV